MGKVISIANHKGGVGKTTTVASLGACLSSLGYNTLMIDLDAQANLTGSFMKVDSERSIYDALREREGLPIVKVKDRLHLVPSSLDMAGIELELSSSMSREFILKDLISDQEGRFDYILLDCPPSLGLIAVNAFVASTDIIVPLTAEALPFKGLTMIESVIGMVRKRLNPSLHLSGIVFCRWEGRKLNRMVEDTLRGTYGEVVMRTRIRTNISLAEAPLSREDILSYNPSSNGAADYMALTREIIGMFNEQKMK